jgi:hypothetical protein
MHFSVYSLHTAIVLVLSISAIDFLLILLNPTREIAKPDKKRKFYHSEKHRRKSLSLA